MTTIVNAISVIGLIICLDTIPYPFNLSRVNLVTILKRNSKIKTLFAIWSIVTFYNTSLNIEQWW